MIVEPVVGTSSAGRFDRLELNVVVETSESGEVLVGRAGAEESGSVIVEPVVGTSGASSTDAADDVVAVRMSLFGASTVAEEAVGSSEHTSSDTAPVPVADADAPTFPVLRIWVNIDESPETAVVVELSEPSLLHAPRLRGPASVNAQR